MVSQDFLSEINKVLSDTSTIICSAYAKLFTNDYKSIQWRDSLLSGVLVLLVERSLQTFLIRLYSFGKFEVIFETELYYNFAEAYLQLTDLFYSFPVPGGQIGLTFQGRVSAGEFSKYIKVYSPREKLKSHKSEHSVSINNPGWFDNFKIKILKKKEKSGKGKIEISSNSKFVAQFLVVSQILRTKNSSSLSIVFVWSE